LSIGQAVAVAVQLCDALETVHRNDILHRDVKPANVLISRSATGDHVELLDFGIATTGNEHRRGPIKLTKVGELLGTVEYMSPEQLMESAPIGARADVYATGVVLYECLTGEVPFGGSPTAMIAGFLQGRKPPSLRDQRSEVPARLEAAVNAALEIDPARRYACATELATACIEALDCRVPQIDLLDVHDDLSPAAPRSSHRVISPPALKLDTDEPQRRRQFVRAPYVTLVHIELGEGKSLDGRSEDISEDGVLVVTETDCAVGQRVKVRLPLPTSGRTVTLDATTKWYKASRTQRAIGIEFLGTPEEVRAEIRAYAALMTWAPQKPPQISG
jgi:serine/threonine protein kinase